jgi:hypothetical protein
MMMLVLFLLGKVSGMGKESRAELKQEDIRATILACKS